MRSRKKLEIIDARNFVPEDIIPQTSGHMPLTEIVLGCIAIAGVLSVALIAPNAVQLLKYVNVKHKPKYDFRYRVPETVRRLEKRGYIVFVQEGDATKAVITQAGKDVLLKRKAHAYAQYKKPEQWDGKWRVVIFDVKEKRKTRRDLFRMELKRIGFTRIQNSVWVFPYDCEEMISLLKMEKEIGKEVLYLVADHVENDKALRHLFGVST